MRASPAEGARASGVGAGLPPSSRRPARRRVSRAGAAAGGIRDEGLRRPPRVCPAPALISDTLASWLPARGPCAPSKQAERGAASPMRHLSPAGGEPSAAGRLSSPSRVLILRPTGPARRLQPID